MTQTSAALSPLGRVHPARQERSRRTLSRILGALTALLEKKPFDEITIAELARRSGAAVTSIYARFEDKRALILAAHERHRDTTIAELDRLLDPVRWKGASLRTIVTGAIASVLAARRKQQNLLRAALLINDPEVYERAAQIVRHGSERLAALLAPHTSWLRPGERERAVDFALRAVTATIQQRELFGAAEPGRFGLSQSEFEARLASLFIGALGSPHKSKPKGRVVKRGSGRHQGA